MSDHTPGPWKAYVGPISMSGGLNPFFKGIVAMLRHSGDDECVAVITDQNIPAFEYEANAQLIAAAPDLLAALEDIVACIDDGSRCDLCQMSSGHTSDCPMPVAKAAIAKARGQS